MRLDDGIALTQAVQSLEAMNLATKISQWVDMPIEKAMAALPGHWLTVVAQITKAALEKALNASLLSLKSFARKSSNKIHSL
ncbi:MAG: hypothetical protein ACU83N_16390 [Gammaproteobacteria bacterium]